MTDISQFAEPASPNGREIFVPASRQDWRRWLADHPVRQDGVWLIYRKKSSAIQGPVYDDLVEEALCFGWIDSVVRPVDEHRTMQWFSPRRKGGLWSASNKSRIERLIAQGMMTDRGQTIIDQAIADGSWAQADAADALIVPDDLKRALASEPAAKVAYESLTDSAKKTYLWRVYSAKRPQTRLNRIEAIVQELTPAD